VIGGGKIIVNVAGSIAISKKPTSSITDSEKERRTYGGVKKKPRKGRRKGRAQPGERGENTRSRNLDNLPLFNLKNHYLMGRGVCVLRRKRVPIEEGNDK